MSAPVTQETCACGKPATFLGVCVGTNGWWETYRSDVPLCPEHIGIIDLAELKALAEDRGEG